MKSAKARRPGKFRPFRKPTPKVREAWSKLATTLSAGSFTGASVIASNDVYSPQSVFRVLELCALGVLLQLIAVYVLKGSDHVL